MSTPGTLTNWRLRLVGGPDDSVTIRVVGHLNGSLIVTAPIARRLEDWEVECADGTVWRLERPKRPTK